MPDSSVTGAAVTAALRRAGLTGADDSARRRAEYSADASLYRVVPAVVAFPRDAGEVAAAVEVCRSLRVPLTARGAGTSIAGNAVGPGVVLDFSRHMNRIHHLDPESATAVVDPGVILDDLQRRAAPHGLRFGPDPSTHSRCTIGGMIGNNACGSRALGYGRTAGNLVELDVVTGTGERLLIGRGGWEPALLAGLRREVAARLGVIRTEFGRFGRQASGYSLEHLLPERGFDVAAALAGTEGTLAVLHRATVSLVRAPAATALAVLGYPDMATAADAVPSLLPGRPVAVEGLDSRLVAAARRGNGAVPDLPRGAGWLLAEAGGGGPAEAAARAGALLAGSGALAGRVVRDPGEAAALWKIREDGSALAARIGGRNGPALSGWEDAAVPPERLGAYLRDFEALLAERGLTGIPYGHFGDGCLHVRIDFPLGRPGGRAAFRAFLADAAALVASYGGSMSGEHGDGRARSELLPLMYSAAALDAFAAVKRVFDPLDVLNPGVIVRPRPADADLRAESARPHRTGLRLRYPGDGGDFSAAVHRCTGVGRCRVGAGAGGVMCPSFRATGDEKDSTRGRARVLQEMANGSLVAGWRSPEVADALDLCLSCKACASECPTGVDMASYKAEVLYQRYRHRPRPAAHYSLGWLPVWARLAARAPRLANAVLSGPLAPVLKRAGGIDSRRPLPAFAPRTFRQWFAGHRPAPGDPVLLWVDTFTNHFVPQAGIAAVRVLEDAGFCVSIPRRRLCCGLTWISTGQLGTARRVLARTTAALAEVAGAGGSIVGLEPSCTAVLRADAAGLLGPGPQVTGVVRSVRTLAELLAERGWRPPGLAGADVVVQPHCHHRAVLGFDADRALLAGAGARLTVVEGCCGLAGNFGAERGHYGISAAVAQTALLPALRAARPGAVLLTDGFSCRVQAGQLAHADGLHLAELLAARLPATGPEVTFQ